MDTIGRPAWGVDDRPSAGHWLGAERDRQQGVGRVREALGRPAGEHWFGDERRCVSHDTASALLMRGPREGLPPPPVSGRPGRRGLLDDDWPRLGDDWASAGDSDARQAGAQAGRTRRGGAGRPQRPVLGPAPASPAHTPGMRLRAPRGGHGPPGPQSCSRHRGKAPAARLPSRSEQKQWAQHCHL